jgi:hypothetical protein
VTTQHIGAAGELLVQYRLLKAGIDSARLTTDAGIDLVVYAPGNATGTTVQVKSNLAAGPAGGRGQLSRGWNFPHTCPAQLLALVALDVDRALAVHVGGSVRSGAAALAEGDPQVVLVRGTADRRRSRRPA